MSMSDDDLLEDDLHDLNLLEVTAYADDHQYMRVAKKRKMESDIHGEATLQFIQSIDDKLFSEMAKMNSKLDQVHSLEEDGGRLVEEFQNFKVSHNETSGAALREFEQEKQKFLAELVELRKKKKGLLASLAGHIREVNGRVKMRIRVHQDLQDRIVSEGRRRRTATAATTSVIPPSDQTATATAMATATATASEASPSDPTAIATASDVTPSAS